MDAGLNITPDLTQDDITKKLFNRQFLSDISFSVEDKIIYAHSFELMKQSRVFQQQLGQTLDDKKYIPIIGYKYDSFYQFMSFIYTDRCDIDSSNAMELLKLAVHYKVVRLENRMLDFISGNMNLQLYEFCVLQNYTLAKSRTQEAISRTLNSRLDCTEFLALHPDAVEEILKFDPTDVSIKEVQLFEALARWMDAYCKKQQIKLADGRQRFDKLIRLIRFGTMQPDDIRYFKTKYPDILTKSDLMAISSQIMLGSDGDDIWNSTPRAGITAEFEWKEFSSSQRFETKFSVSINLMLSGIRFVMDSNNSATKKAVNIEFSSHNNQTKQINTIKFSSDLSSKWMSAILSFGDSIRLQPNFLYTISFDYMSNGRTIKLRLREKNQNIIIDDPLKMIRLIQQGENMAEMFFRQPE